MHNFTYLLLRSISCAVGHFCYALLIMSDESLWRLCSCIQFLSELGGVLVPNWCVNFSLLHRLVLFCGLQLFLLLLIHFNAFRLYLCWQCVHVLLNTFINYCTESSDKTCSCFLIDSPVVWYFFAITAALHTDIKNRV